MSETLLETRGISKDFSSVYVLKDVNIQVIRGEILGKGFYQKKPPLEVVLAAELITKANAANYVNPDEP
jgi:hypothetical protein